MYPPRSQRSEVKKKTRRTRKRIVWVINLLLIVMIGLVCLYYVIEMREQADRAVEVTTVNPESSGEVEPQGGDSLTTPEATPETDDTAEEEPAVSNDQDAEEASKDQTDNTEDAANTDTNNTSGTDIKQPAKPSKSDSSKGNGSSAAAPGNQEPVHSANDVTIHFVGDIQFSGKVAELLEKNGYDYPFQKLGNLFKDDDLTIGNLETPVTTGGTGAANKTYVYKSSPKALAAMADAGFDAVNLANNHILDQGVEGLVDTLGYLKEYGIAHTGAGMNQDEAYAPTYLERKGMKIALLGFSRVVPETSWKAEGNRAGVAEAYSSTAAVKAIQDARNNADLVIVVAHWGVERVSTPNDDQTRLAHEFVDAGADLVIGGHPHVLQGMEYYKGKWIAYSTGNFIFSKSTTEETWKTAVFQARCSAEAKCSMKVIPYEAALGQAIPMLGEANKLLLQQMTELSPGVRFDANGVAFPS